MSRFTFSSSGELRRSFTSIRETLLEGQYQDQLTKPLAYWALPNDRRLPLAFLNRSIGDLINTPFEELTATPGVGAKKISSLVKLLKRATKDEPPTLPLDVVTTAETSDGETKNIRFDGPQPFDASMVSEALWSKWTSLIRELNLGDEKLGRVAASLAALPTVIWSKSLNEYQDLSLAQIRGLRTHGEKRVRCVMEVVHRVYTVAQQYRSEGDEAIRRNLGSQTILKITHWLSNEIRSEDLTTQEGVRENLAQPILDQIQVDCGDTVYRIARQRIGLDNEPMSVRDQAQTMGVTRARIYQLLDDCHKVLDVRWPEGKNLLDRMTAKYGSYIGTKPIDASLFLAVRQLCFPDRNEQAPPKPRTNGNGETQSSVGQSYLTHARPNSFATDTH